MSAALRPMTIGEILDRTFTQYRQNFKLFVAIGMVPAVVWFITSAVFLLMTKLQSRSHAGFSRGAVLVSGASVTVGFLIYMCGIAVAHGAVSYAVSAIHLGRPVGFSESYRRIKGKFFRILNVVISVGIRIGGGFLLVMLTVSAMTLLPGIRGNQAAAALVAIVWIIAMVIAIWFMFRMLARYSLSVPACVLEDLPARKAIKRSVALSKGSVGRILAVYLLFTIVNLAFAFAAAVPFQLALAAAKSEVARVILALGNQTSSCIISAVVGPLVTIALTLVYYDERIRKEAFDLNYMMEMLDGQVPQQSSTGGPATGPIPA